MPASRSRAYSEGMSTADTVTVCLLRSVTGEIPSLADNLTARMDELLKRNADGALNPHERLALETLVHMAQFAQVLATALQAGSKE